MGQRLGYDQMVALKDEIDERTYGAFVDYVIDQRSVEDVCRDHGISRNNLYTIKWRLTEKLATHMRALLGEEDGS